MPPRIAVLTHQHDAGPGSVGEGLHEAGAEVAIVDHVGGAELPALEGLDGLVVLGATANVDEGHRWMAAEVELLRDAVDRELPTLGICAGAQLLCLATGGEVTRMAEAERGWFEVEVLDRADPLIGPMPDPLIAAQWHAYTCHPPPHATLLARNEGGAQAFRAGPVAYGVQFHPEVTRAGMLAWAAKDGRREELENETGRRAPAWEAAGRELGKRFAYLASRQKSL